MTTERTFLLCRVYVYMCMYVGAKGVVVTHLSK